MSIGALVAILALAFDTFSQQVITVDFRNVGDPTYKNLATVLRSQSITVENAVNEFPIKAAIANGIYNSDTPDLTAYCPAGNCTWPRIPTQECAMDAQMSPMRSRRLVKPAVQAIKRAITRCQARRPLHTHG